MQIVRRLYLYLISGITLGVLAVGIELLVFAVLRGLGVGGGSILGNDTSSTRVQLSQAVALIAVGLPVWLVHWWLVERGLRPANPSREAERTSAVRALYLTLVLTVTLLVAVNSAASFLRTVAHTVLGTTPEFSFDAPALALPAIVVSAAVWLYHWLIRRRDVRAGLVRGSAAWLPRLYLYGAAALGFISALGGIGDLIRTTASRLLPGNVLAGDPGFGGGSLVDASIGTVLWAAVWLGHWWYLARSTRGDDPQALDEARSRVRLVYFIGIVGFAATRSLLDLVDAGRVILASALGAESILGVTPGFSVLIRETLVPVLTANLWAWAAWTHLRWLRAESRTIDEGQRAPQVERLRSYGLSLVGLAVGATGLAGLLGLLLNLAFGRQAVLLDPASWRLELAGFVPMVILGSALWLWQWRGVLKRQAADPRAEALSTTRRAALLLPVTVAIVAGLGSAVLVLYRLVAVLLGAVLTDPLSDLAKALGILVVAAAVAAYHGLLLRRDLAIRAEAALEARAAEGPAPAAPAEALAAVDSPAVQAPAESVVVARRELVLSGPVGSDLESVVATLRASLPAGHSLSEAPAEPT